MMTMTEYLISGYFCDIIEAENEEKALEKLMEMKLDNIHEVRLKNLKGAE